MMSWASKRDLLMAVKEHAYKVPGGVTVSGSESDGNTTGWGGFDWRRAFQGLFLDTGSQAPVQSQEADDLLFYVWSSALLKGKTDPFTVRRLSSSIPNDLFDVSARAPHVLIGGCLRMGSSTCRKSMFHPLTNSRMFVNRRNDSQPALSEPLVQIRSKVYASPSFTPLSIDTKSRKNLARNPEPCWPELSFSVSNFDEEFESMVVSREDCCFCVILALADTERSSNTEAQQGSSSSMLPGEVAFSGLVTYSQLEGAMASGGGFFSLLLGDAKTRKIVMRGPGGQGNAEVAVTKLSTQDPDASRSGKVALRCCLMNLSLPWEAIAACILRTIE